MTITFIILAGFVQALWVTGTIANDRDVASWSTLAVSCIVAALFVVAVSITYSVAYLFISACLRAVTIAIIELTFLGKAQCITGLISKKIYVASWGALTISSIVSTIGVIAFGLANSVSDMRVKTIVTTVTIAVIL